MPPTPDQHRQIERLTKSFAEDWYLDFATKEIRHKDAQGLRRLVDLLWRRRHKVFALYWWCKKQFAEPHAMAFPFPIRHDNMPIAGFPVKYELQGGWTIPRRDLRYLLKGPLASENLSEVLVAHDLGWQRFLNLVRKFGPLGALVTFAGVLVRYWPEMRKVWEWLWAWL
jgi:hypothetical protein